MKCAYICTETDKIYPYVEEMSTRIIRLWRTYMVIYINIFFSNGGSSTILRFENLKSRENSLKNYINGLAVHF